MRLSMTSEGIAITRRFFLALDTLKDNKSIRGVKTFTDKYNINYWNFSTLRKEPEKRILKPEWLSYLVRDYNINPVWLLTGAGNIFV